MDKNLLSLKWRLFIILNISGLIITIFSFLIDICIYIYTCSFCYNRQLFKPLNQQIDFIKLISVTDRLFLKSKGIFLLIFFNFLMIEFSSLMETPNSYLIDYFIFLLINLEFSRPVYGRNHRIQDYYRSLSLLSVIRNLCCI